MLKLWSRSNVKGDKVWDKVVRFIFAEEHNGAKTVEEILLS